MAPIDIRLKEFIEVQTLLSSEYKKFPPSSNDLDDTAGYFAELLRARLHQYLEDGDRRQAVKLISEIRASLGGIVRPLRARLREVTLAEMGFLQPRVEQAVFVDWALGGNKRGHQ